MTDHKLNAAPSPPRASNFVDELSARKVGIGTITMAPFPLAIPLVVLVAVRAAAAAAAAAPAARGGPGRSGRRRPVIVVRRLCGQWDE